ncbi:P-II family nitrogen regulator [Caldicellulosiruptoraceae bacterium PP1]
MKEVMAIIRMNKINETKEALLKEGFPSLHCIKVLGRGKKKVNFVAVDNIQFGEIKDVKMAESITEEHRLIPKRLISLIVKDSDAENVIKTVLAINSKGNPGDGKIFVMPVCDAFRVRTNEKGEEAL